MQSTLYGKFVVVANSGLELTYALRPEFHSLAKGNLCLLPLKSGKIQKKVVGIFLTYCDKPNFKCVEIISKFPFPVYFNQIHLSLIEWVSAYYITPLHKTLHILAPGFIWNLSKHELLKKRIELFESEQHKKIAGEILLEKNLNIQLNSEQEQACESILKNPNIPSLLYGVTGSGKTEVYLKIAQKIIAQGKTVLMLVPEIALTPQMTSRFRAVFGNDLCVLHSGLNQSDYMRQWLKINFETAKVVLGVRTAVFCPLKNCVLIIVDEEHDSSYKSSEQPCTHSRDIAVYRAHIEGALCILGSATPSCESFYNVQLKKYQLVEIKQKYSSHKTNFCVVNAKEEFDLKKGYLQTKLLKASFVEFNASGLCSSVISALKENKKNHQQSMILINRRGYVNYAICCSCATCLSCPNCSISTTLHQKGNKEICHYCGFSIPTRKTCSSCGGTSFLLKGIGTQNIEEKLKEYLPELNIDRLDRDVLTSNSRLSKIINDFKDGKTDCLIGTQLLAKGHDFEKVTLVVILHVEDSLFLPDFRSAERTFQLITQAMGRAGRGHLEGQVILQSFIINHPVVEFALQHDLNGFLERELSQRKLAWHPPFCRQVLFEIKHLKLQSAQDLGKLLAKMLVEHWKIKGFLANQIRLAGPYQATMEKLNSYYRVQLCVSFERKIHPKYIVPDAVWSEKELIRALKIDVDPLSFL